MAGHDGRRIRGVPLLAGIGIIGIMAAVVALTAGPGSSARPANSDSGSSADVPPASVVASPSDQPPTSARGYLVTPAELAAIAQDARDGVDPSATAMAEVLEWAETEWDYELAADQGCPPDEPAWIDNDGGVPTLYARALAFHLTGEEEYAIEVADILERIMSTVETISLDEDRCRLVFGWGTPELVASADLIEEHWEDQTCEGPTSSEYGVNTVARGDCKGLFQNWLVKNPYYVMSYSAISSQSNWGAAATNGMAHIADYLWDRPDMALVHREPDGDEIAERAMNPSEAYAFTKQLAFDRMNGYGVELGSSSACDHLSGGQQSAEWPPVKSQITADGIVTEDARREEFCNIGAYNGRYQNYPQLHLGNVIAHCELMLRRGDSSCYDNVDNSSIPDYTFTGPNGDAKHTELHPGRGSVERAIKAIIVDSDTEWRRAPALAVAYRYYSEHGTLPGIAQWPRFIVPTGGCSQDICFGVLTHGLAPGATPSAPPMVGPP